MTYRKVDDRLRTEEKSNKNETWLEPLTDAVLGYVYEKLNNPPETEEEKKNRHWNGKAKIKIHNRTQPKNTKHRTTSDAVHQIGLNSLSVRQEENVQNAEIQNLDSLQIASMSDKN